MIGGHMTSQVPTVSQVGSDHAGWAGHPRGLSTLFFTEMWERFSYYGMRGFLILYMTKALGFTDQHAGSVYGNYVGSVWLTFWSQIMLARPMNANIRPTVTRS